MSNLHPIPNDQEDQETEALYWLDLAKRVLSGDLSPAEARRTLRSDDLYAGAPESNDQHSA